VSRHAKNTPSTRILVIGLSQEDQLFLQQSLESEPYECVFTKSATQAQQIIFENSPTFFNAYLLDDLTDHNENLTLLKTLNISASYSTIPIIFQTHEGNAHQIQAGLEHGAFFYLLTPYNKSLLMSVLKAAIKGFANYSDINRRIQDIEAIRPLLQSATFHIKTLEEAKSLSSVLSYATPNFKEVAIGLFELMINAIEHGNLGITYQEKTQMIQDNSLQNVIKSRLKQEEYADRFVKVRFERTLEHIHFIIEDCGQGFDYKEYLNFSKQRAMDNHGRGIMIANRLSFDSLEYSRQGSTVTAGIKLSTA